jgi:hypothetical protein
MANRTVRTVLSYGVIRTAYDMNACVPSRAAPPRALEDRAAPRHQHCVWRRRAGTRRIGYASPFGHLGRAAPPPAPGGGGWHPFSWPVSSALFGSLRVVRCLTESPQSIANSMFHNARQGSSFFGSAFPTDYSLILCDLTGQRVWDGYSGWRAQ